MAPGCGCVDVLPWQPAVHRAPPLASWQEQLHTCVRCRPLPCSLPFPKAINEQLNTHPGKAIVPKCLNLGHNTRMCRVRVDTGRQLVETVLPLLMEHHPSFADDIVLFNFG